MKMQPKAKRIKGLREQRAWSQQQLAEICAVSERTIQRVEQGESVAFETLKAIAAAFNLDVSELVEKAPKEPAIHFLVRAATGTDLFNVVAGAHAGRYSHDELRPDETDMVSSFLQDLQDYCDLWDDIGPGQQVRARQEFSERISDLEAAGLWVFVTRLPEKFKIKDQIVTWQVSSIAILRKDNPTIVSLPEDGGEVLPAASNHT